MRRPSVVIEVEACVPRPRKDGKGMTRTRHRQWVPVGRWPVVYKDKHHTVVRQFGSISIYESYGAMLYAGYRRDHPKASLIPARTLGWWRIQPGSLRK